MAMEFYVMIDNEERRAEALDIALNPSENWH